MKRNHRIILAIASLALAALACEAVTGGGTSTAVAPANTDDPTILTQPSMGKVLLSDDFSYAQWGTGTDSDSSVEYVDEAL